MNFNTLSVFTFLSNSNNPISHIQINKVKGLFLFAKEEKVLQENNKKTDNQLQLVPTEKTQNHHQNLSRVIEINIPRNFLDNNRITDCLVYKTKYCHLDYNDNILINVTGEFFLRYTDNNRVERRKIFPFTQSFLADFYPYYIRIPSPAEIDFSGQEIRISQTITVSEYKEE